MTWQSKTDKLPQAKMMTAMTEDPKGEELSLAFARLATCGAKNLLNV
jgi:hypothetical protein